MAAENQAQIWQEMSRLMESPESNLMQPEPERFGKIETGVMVAPPPLVESKLSVPKFNAYAQMYMSNNPPPPIKINPEKGSPPPREAGGISLGGGGGRMTKGPSSG